MFVQIVRFRLSCVKTLHRILTVYLGGDSLTIWKFEKVDVCIKLLVDTSKSISISFCLANKHIVTCCSLFQNTVLCTNDLFSPRTETYKGKMIHAQLQQHWLYCEGVLSLELLIVVIVCVLSVVWCTMGTSFSIVLRLWCYKFLHRWKIQYVIIK